MKIIKQYSIKSPEDFFINLKNRISKTDMIAFVSAAFLCLMIHFFAYTNTLFVHDSILLYDASNGLQNGRFMVNLLMPLFSRITMPWLIGLFTSVLLGLTNVFIVKILKLKRKLSILLTAAILASFPVMAANHIYFSSVYIYVFAMLMATLCVYFADKNIVLSAMCLIMSLSSYQAYLCFATTLFLVKMLVDMMGEEIQGKTVVLKGLKYIGIILTSVILYYALWKCLIVMLDVETISYRGYSELEKGLFVNIGNKLLTTVAYSLYFVFGNLFALSPIMKFIYILINLFAIIFTFFNIPKKSKNRKFALLIFLLLPITISMIYIINPYIIHMLMLPAAMLPVLLFVKNIECIEFESSNTKNAVRWVSVVCIVSVICSFSVTTNATYLKAKSQFDNSISYCTRILDRFEQTEGFNEDTKVIVVSDVYKYGIYKPDEWSKNKVFTITANSNGAVTFPGTLPIFLRQELNTNIDITFDEKDEYKEFEEVKKLEPFPSQNCITWIDGVMIFKMG